MPFELLPALLLSVLAVGYSPGPANLYTMACALRYGRKAALRMWLGLLTGFLVAAVAAASLIHCFGSAFGEYVTYFKYVGGAYMLLLAYKMWRSTGVSGQNDTGCSFISGMVVQLTNAKIILFDLTVYSVYVLPYSHRFPDLLLMIPALLVAGPVANLVWLLMGSFLSRLFRQHQRQVSIAMAVALALSALVVMFV